MPRLATQVILDLRQPKRRIDRHGNRAGKQNGEKRDEEVAARRQHDRDPIPRTNAAFDQAAGGGASLAIKLSVSDRFRPAVQSPQQNMVAVGVTLRMHGERLDQSSRLDWLFHCCKAKPEGTADACRLEDRGTRRENCFHEVARMVGLADQPLRKLHLEFTIQPQEQFRPRKTVERQIAIEVAV